MICDLIVSSVSIELNLVVSSVKLNFGVSLLFLFFLPKVLFDLDPRPSVIRKSKDSHLELTHPRVVSQFLVWISFPNEIEDDRSIITLFPFIFIGEPIFLLFHINRLDLDCLNLYS